MGSIGNYLEDELLDHVLKVGSYSQPTIYVALSTADPTDDASGIAEPSGNNYARKAHATWNTAASRAITNDGAITFNQASGSWGTISHYAIYDAATDGNMLAHGALSSSKAIVSGNTPSIPDEDIEVSFSAGGISDYLANELLDHVFGVGAYTVPTNLYICLCDAAPTDSSTGSTISEPSGNNYSRLNENTWDAASGGATANTGDSTFATPSGSWGEITHSAICDASSDGNMLFWATATPNQTPDNGDTVKFAAGEYDITLA